jgi:benzoylformate decarboxylase
LAAKTPMRAPLFMKALAERLRGKDVLTFDEAFTHSDELTRYLSKDKPGTFFQRRVGMLGTGLPGTVGLKAAYPDKVVFGFCGDGGSMSTIQALSTAARYGLGAKFVVCNNRSYRILKYNLLEYWTTQEKATTRSFPPSFDLTVPELRFDKLAEGQGVRALRVEKPEQVARAIDAALEDDEPFLIDLVLDSAL